MSVSHKEVMSKLSPERRARIEARTQELIEEEMPCAICAKSNT